MGSRADDPSMHDTLTAIELYRQDHRITTRQAPRPGLGLVAVCTHDGLRVHPIRPMGRWRHDIVEVREASRGSS